MDTSQGLEAKQELIAWFESHFICDHGLRERFADKTKNLEYVTVASLTEVREVDNETVDAAALRCVRAMILRLEHGLVGVAVDSHLFWRESGKVLVLSNYDFKSAGTHVIVLTRVVSPQVRHWPLEKPEGMLVERI